VECALGGFKKFPCKARENLYGVHIQPQIRKSIEAHYAKWCAEGGCRHSDPNVVMGWGWEDSRELVSTLVEMLIKVQVDRVKGRYRPVRILSGFQTIGISLAQADFKLLSQEIFVLSAYVGRSLRNTSTSLSRGELILWA